MDLCKLRNLLTLQIVGGKDRTTHREIPALCEELGLTVTRFDDGQSKADRLSAALAETPDCELPNVACRLLERWPMLPADRNKLQDIIWPAGRPIPKRYRHEIARDLCVDSLFGNASKFDDLIASLFVVEDVLDDFFERSSTLKGQIERHVHHNPGDWDVEYLFNQLGAFDATDTRFARFLEGLVSPDVMESEQSQRRFVEIVNPHLAKCGLAFRETSEQDGYPVFTLVVIDCSSAGRPKNLIFASPLKPDLRFRDAVNNDIEIVTNADKVLIYDRPIPVAGIRWRDLQAWWKELNGIVDDNSAKESLYYRLRESLPGNSPPQCLFFDLYHRTFGMQIPLLPALLPEVWLHWDPQTVKKRGANALVRSRMDFLMLLPCGIRVVLEIDGQQHYSKDGRPSPALYAQMVAADRQLRLDGYHVFRFGGTELNNGRGEEIVRHFFRAMFERFGVELH